MTVSRVEDGSEFDSTKTINLYRNTVKRICDLRQLKKRKSNIVLSIYSIYQMFKNFQLTASGEGGCPGADAPRPAEEELSPSPGTVILLLRPIEEMIARGNHQEKGLAGIINVS